MKRKLYFYLVTILIVIVVNNSFVKASHLAGAEISWKCLGGDTFLLTATVYRDCNGVALAASPFTVSSSCGKQSYNTIISSGLDITPVCKKACDRCKSLGCTFAYGVERYTQTAKVILSTSCCKYDFGWGGTAARSGSLTTLNQGNFYVEAMLNRCQKPCDNSPVFTGNPLLITCTNQCVVYSCGASDKDIDNNGQADSLVYKLTQPLTAKDTPLAYTGSYNYKEPLKYYGAFGKPDLAWDPPKCQGFHLDSTDGTLLFRATKTDATVIAILVEEWRKDSAGIPRLIGKVTRDVEVAIMDCPSNIVPVISGIDSTSNTSISFCANMTKCFYVTTYDADSVDTLTLGSNVNSIPGATFTIDTGKQHPTGTFCWKPQQAQYRSYPYFLVVNVQDNACPVNGRTTKTFKLYVKPKPEANYSATVDQCGYVVFKTVNSGMVPITKYLWTGDDGLNIKGSVGKKYYKDPGSYGYTLSMGSVDGCPNSYTDSVKIPPHVDIDLPKDTSVCYGTTLTIKGTPRRGVAPFTYSWAYSALTVNSRTVTITKDTMFTEYIQDRTGCIGLDSIHIKSTPYPKVYLPNDTIVCSGSTITITGEAKFGTPPYKYNWSNSNETTNTLTTEIINDITYRFYALDKGGCSGFEDIVIKAKQLPKPNLGFNKTICVDSIKSVMLDAHFTEKGTTIKWYKLNPLTFIGNNKYILPVKDTGKFYVEITDSLGCIGTDTIEIKIGTKPVVVFTIMKGKDGAVTFNTTSKGRRYYWDFGDHSGSGIQNPTHTYSYNGIYVVSLMIIDSNGCDSTLTQTITISNIGTIFISETLKDFPFTISLNPNTASSTINYSLLSNSNVEIIVLDMIGREVYVYRNSNQSAGKHQLKISDAEVKDAGIYLIHFSANGIETVRKFAKVK